MLLCDEATSALDPQAQSQIETAIADTKVMDVFEHDNRAKAEGQNEEAKPEYEEQ